ncbi:hypothetical protein AX16_010106 [Volvariella volvacea WC 439]|nr:hypothetical protein AX16_010106 [Volvariella volvacea WC 439]
MSDRREIEQFLPVLPMISETLKSLTMSPPYDFQFSWVNGVSGDSLLLIDLSILTRLTRLEFIIHENCNLEDTYIPWVVSQLSTFSSSNSNLTSLHIRAIIDEWIVEFPSPETQRKWGKLDNTLTDAQYDNLQNIHIHLQGNRWIYRPEEHFSWLERVLSRIKERKALFISSKDLEI